MEGTETQDAFDESFMSATADVPESLGDAAQTSTVQSSEVRASVTIALSVEALEATFGTFFNMIAVGIGEGGEFWQLSPIEKRNLAAAWHPVLEPWFAAWGANNPGLIIAGGMTLLTLAPRLAKEKKRRAEKSPIMPTPTENSSPQEMFDKGSAWTPDPQPSPIS